MHKWLMLLLTGIGLATAPARSEVLAADADAACALLIQPARWWNGQHSYSGDAANMRIDARAGGCFCEAIVGYGGEPDGSVEHGRVLYAAPGRQLRLVGALGPLQAEAVTGTLVFTIMPVERGSRIALNYHVGGYRQDGLHVIAPMMDKVLAEQRASLRPAAESSGSAGPAIP